MKTVEIQGEERKDIGKTAAKAIRKSGKVPCIMYSKMSAAHFTAEPLELRDVIYTSDFKLVNININGSVSECILKDVQFHPVTDVVMHVDFLKLEKGTSIKVDVPVRFKGIAEGVKQGGKIQQTLRKVKIKTTPEKLVDELILDVKHLKLGQSIRVRDIKDQEGVEILSAKGIPVATIEIPRALKSAGAKAEKEELEEKEQ